MALTGWLRRKVGWSNSLQSWQERIGITLVLAGAALLGWLGRELPLSRQVALWALLLLTLAVLARRGWLRLFGPVFFYDLVRATRRRRSFLFRTLYAGLLFLLIAWIYLIWITDRRGGSIPTREMATFAASFFYPFLFVQFALAVLLTPATVASAIAEEKDRKTLEFILTTDLRDREIVVGKLASRLVTLTFLILTGLPILSLLQFLGGVDPGLMFTGFAATGLTMVSLAGLGIFNSVLAKRPRDAIALTYLGAVGYLLLSGLGELLLHPSLGTANFPSTATWTSPVTLQDVVEWANTGNFVTGFARTMDLLFRGKSLDEFLPGLLRDYAIFHGLAAVGFTVLAVARLRPVALKQSYGKAAKLSMFTRWWGRPRVGNEAMLWKEIFAEPGLRFHWLGRIAIGCLVLGSFVPVVLILNDHLGGRISPWRNLGREMNVWVRFMSTIVGGLTLLGVAVRASGVISGERDKQTFDALLTSPLGSNQILFAKWLGNILSVRWGWVWLGSIWLLGLLTGGLYPFALPLLPLAWFVYAAVYSSLGLWFSTVCKTTLRSTIWTLFTVLAISAGHWLIMAAFCYMPLSLLSHSRARGEVLETIAKIEAGQTPPAVLAILACHKEDVENTSAYRSRDFDHFLLSSIFGIISWAGLAAIVWGVTSVRFRVVTGRQSIRRPEFFAVSRPRRPIQSAAPSRPPARTRGAILIAEEVDDIPIVLPAEEEGPEKPRPRTA